MEFGATSTGRAGPTKVAGHFEEPSFSQKECSSCQRVRSLGSKERPFPCGGMFRRCEGCVPARARNGPAKGGSVLPDRGNDLLARASAPAGTAARFAGRKARSFHQSRWRPGRTERWLRAKEWPGSRGSGWKAFIPPRPGRDCCAGHGRWDGSSRRGCRARPRRRRGSCRARLR